MRTFCGCLILSAFLAGCHNIQVKRIDHQESVALRQAVEAPWERMAANAAPTELELGVIHFERGRADITGNAARQLDILAARVNELDGLVMIEGHASSSEEREENRRLGYLRALATAKRLRDSGVWEERIVVQSFGATRPAANQWQRAEYSLNERVAVRVFPQGGRLEGKSAEQAARQTLPQDKPASSPMMIGVPIMQPQ